LRQWLEDLLRIEQVYFSEFFQKDGELFLVFLEPALILLAYARYYYPSRYSGKDGKQRWIRAVDLRPANLSEP
jgi:hypothetical protein